MSLEQWRENGWLTREDAKLPEIAQLFSVVDRELNDANASGLSPDGRFMHGYDAALILCMIGLRVCGYRVKKGSGHHVRAIESLPHTLGPETQSLSDQVDIASRKRGQAMYDRAGVVTSRDADDLVATATELRERVVEWLRANHSRLLPKGLL